MLYKIREFYKKNRFCRTGTQKGVLRCLLNNPSTGELQMGHILITSLYFKSNIVFRYHRKNILRQKYYRLKYIKQCGFVGNIRYHRKNIFAKFYHDKYFQSILSIKRMQWFRNIFNQILAINNKCGLENILINNFHQKKNTCRVKKNCANSKKKNYNYSCG